MVLEKIKRIFVPAKVTSRYAFRRPFTVMYPREPAVQSKRWRGLHELEFSKCTGCGQCARACPNECIDYIIPEDMDLRDRKAIPYRRPTVDWSHCIFCGLCVDICPVNAIRHTDKYSIFGEATDRLDLIGTPYEIAAEEDELKWRDKKLSKKEIVSEIESDPIRKVHYLMQTNLIPRAIGGHWGPILEDLIKRWRKLREDFFDQKISEDEWNKKSREIEEAVYSIIKASSIG